MKYLVTFNSTAHAIKAESILLKNNLKIKIRPVPNEISSGCGISIVFDDNILFCNITNENKIIYNEIYLWKDNMYQKINK